MTRADWLVLIFLIAVQPWLYWHFWRDQGVAQTAVINALEQPPRLVSLRQNQTLAIPGPLGDSMLEIKAGQVRFLASPCRGKQCIHTGWLSRAGEFAACLPNRISVTLIGAAARYDAINY